MEKEMIKILMAILATGAFSTAANVIAVDVHLSYVKESVAKLELASAQQERRVREIELEQAKNQRVVKL